MNERPRWMDHITVQPLDWKEAFGACPFCWGKNVTYTAQMHTLIGGGDGTREGDPNHWHSDARCRDCGETFMQETSCGNVWFTRGSAIGDRSGEVLAGVASCFEHYSYPCTCGAGRITRRYTRLDGVSDVTSLCTRYNKEDGTTTKDYRTFYSCSACGFTEETADDYPRFLRWRD